MKQISNSHLRWPKGRRSCVKYISKERINNESRPMLPQDVITDNLVKQKLFGSAVTVIPTTEVVFVSKDGEESNVALNREELWRTQTPHSYRFDELWTVHNQAIEDGVINMAASCLLMQKYGSFSV